MNNKLVLATNNRDKISEITNMLQGLDITVLSAGNFEDFPRMEETGDTVLKNAVLKAETVFEKYAIPCLADDTGLEVDYLDGAPGVFSSRFAGEGCSYDENNVKLLRLLNNVPWEKRSAKFKTIIAFADFDGKIHTVEGVLQGFIAERQKGSFGFGYDPVFWVPGKNASLAELTPFAKNEISHRGRALSKIKPIIIETYRSRT